MIAEDQKIDKMKRKRVNKNKKKNWRKNIDISDIEKALEIERLEERTGGILSDKPDDEIFFLDKTSGTKILSKAERRKNKRLRVDETIVPNPDAVKPPSKLANRARRRMLKTAEKKLDGKKRNLSKKISPESQTKPFDLWANESLDLYDKETKKTKIGKYTEYIIGERQVKRPKHLDDKPGDVEGYKYRETPAVEVAHPGASYNPTYNEHQDLLAKAHLVEVGKLKAQEKIAKALHVPYDQLPDLDTYQKEMQEGLFDAEKQEEVESGDDDAKDEELPQNPPVRARDRKTKRKRRIEMKEKMEKQQKEKVWGDKLRENEVFRTKTFLAEIKAKESKNAAKRELRKRKTRMLTLSNVKFTEQDIELKLSDEIKGSLRELKPESGLLTDRYKSFQKRGIIEPRCKRNVPKRKRKVKYQEKRAWREIEA